jgi:hypothetical protein
VHGVWAVSGVRVIDRGRLGTAPAIGICVKSGSNPQHRNEHFLLTGSRALDLADFRKRVEPGPQARQEGSAAIFL